MKRWLGDLLARVVYLVLLAIGLIFGLAVTLDHHSPFLLVGVGLTFGALPYLLHRHLPTELRRGQLALAREDYAVAQAHTQRFLDQLARWPGLNGFIRLGLPLGSGSPRVIALTSLGHAAFKTGELEEADRRLAEALRLDPESVWGQFLMALVCFERSRNDEGRAWMARVAAQVPLGPEKELIKFARNAPRAGEEYQAIADSAARDIALPCEGPVQVRLLDDDKTPMAFVVSALEDIFGLHHVDAVRVMLTVDREGAAVCGAFSAEVAQEKLTALLKRAKDADLPLQAELVTLA
ncbi:ATP-dependent Clp protease adaptor ClpS [Caulobacter sp. NIBR1757]|uniref:ATP-dependent Clp protease adaptor ClpS n=1 Tax=Caulobacter sp. NIBR1757 TaxID=3016000 RepID=UPI0022F0786A|nr:ATP-dependent Clp protease adaptor ClpS [Caulobacter sp. NIBR1757]WGM38020.1 ATP-dependent Clp protease adapter protein ClpS [Caulobacter sp. NIBR1757]